MQINSPGGLMTVNQFREFSALGRTKIYQELAKGTLQAVKVGRRTLILNASAHAWLAAQPSYEGA
jgi:excisionase family DNA binding protein